MATRHRDPVPPPDRLSRGAPDLRELIDHVAVDLAREYLGLGAPPLPPDHRLPDSVPEED